MAMPVFAQETMRTLVLSLALMGCSAAMAQEAGGRFDEQIEVRVIDVDVVVTGRDGRPLTNLTRENFELYEDGKRVEIAYFSIVANGRLATAGTFSMDAPEAAPGEAARSPLTWAVFVDQSNIMPSQRNATLRQLRSFMERSVQDEDRGMLATYDGNGFKVRAEGITRRDTLVKILADLEKEGVRPGPESLAAGRLRNQIEDSLPGDAELVRAEISLLIEEEAARTQKSIEAMGSLFDVLQGVEGRLALVYVGNGFSTLPAMTVTEAFRRKFPRLNEAPGRPQPEAHQPILRQMIERLYQRIIATRAAMYSIDAGTERGPSVEDRGSLVADGVVEGSIARLVEAGSARELAQRTGGLYFRTNPGLADQLEAVRTDLMNYYSLGYRPEGTAGRERAIHVRVSVDGAQVRYREAVRERTASEQKADAVVAGLFSPGQANPLGVVVVIEAPRRASSGRKQILPVTLKVPLKDLTFLPRGGGHEGGLFFDFALAANDGTIWQLGTRELPLTIPDAEFASARRKSVSYSVEVPLNRRGSRLSISVQDRIGEVQSVLLVALPLLTRAAPPPAR